MPPVLFEERLLDSGARLGVATLNIPEKLNALSLELVGLLLAKLRAWSTDDRICAVVLEGAGTRAFCAGGDVLAIHRSGGAKDGQSYARAFFAVEYTLDHLIHTFGKPILAWGSGIVMGGGVGLLAGCSHRIATETTRLAMPEVAIGLYPDVGGSYILSRVPERLGLFLALTGATIGGSDARLLGLVDRLVRADEKARVLAAVPWNDLVETPCEPGPLERQHAAVVRACRHDTLEEVVAAIVALNGDEWLTKAQHGLQAACPGSLRLSWEAQARARTMSLADVFRMEHDLSIRRVQDADFAEGVRARLVDKDQKPRWSPATLGAATAAWAAPFFVPLSTPEAHPLRAL
ncbi:MAG: enoyl-CoA hydratase/isomerase family protein [Polyangia bacterium]